MKFQKIILFLLLSIFSNSSSTLLAEKTAFFANSVFKDFITSVVWWHDNADDVTDFIKLFQGCIVIASVQESEASNEVIQQFNIEKFFMQTVIFATEVHEVEYFVSLLYENLVIPIRLIVVLTKPATYTELTELMEIAWNNDVADILVVSSVDENVLLTTYFPYRNGKCGDFTPVYLKDDTKDWFPKKFTNFHGCEIRTTLLQLSPYSRLQFENNTLVSISGIDGNVAHILFDILNASMKVVSARDHGGFGTIVNGTVTGSLADLVNKKADILLPSVLMSQTRYHYVQFTNAHETAIIMWCGPRRLKISEWLRVLQPFISHITPAVFITSIVFIVMTMTVRRFGLPRCFSRDSVPFQTFMIFLGMKVTFETISLTLNCLFALWIWFCMVVRIAFQGDLVDGLQKIVLETPFRTFESAVELVDGYGGIDGVRDFFVGTRHFKNFKIIPLRNATDYFKAIEAGKRFLIATDKKLALDSAPNIQILKDDPVTEVPLCFCMRPGWPAVAYIDNVLTQMMENGFIQKVFKEDYWEWIKAVETKGDRGAKPLTLEALSGCFYGLGVISGVCSIVLFVETFYHSLTRKKICRK